MDWVGKIKNALKNKVAKITKKCFKKKIGYVKTLSVHFDRKQYHKRKYMVGQVGSGMGVFNYFQVLLKLHSSGLDLHYSLIGS